MFPTLIAGLAVVFAAARYARDPGRGRLRMVRHLMGLTFLVSCLGFVTGVIKTFTTVAELDGDVGRLAVTGVGESLCNIGLGLVLMVIATIVSAVGTSRASSHAGRADLADPLAP